jgi:transposase
MRKIREVLRLKFEQGLSCRTIAASCHICATAVHEYLRRAQAAGLCWPLPQELGDDELERLLFPPALPSGTARPLPDFGYISRELRRKGVTLFLLWEEYRRAHPQGYGYSRYCELYAEYAGKAEPRMRQAHKAGEKLFVDYAGHTVPVMHPSGEVREAQVFVATLGASDYTYAEVTWTQSLEDWIGSHVRAFEFFGGVPEIVIPDNLKAGVTRPCPYEPEINPSYLEMAKHYGAAIIPARIARPRDKAKVETHVLNVERRVLAPLRNRVFLNLQECNLAIKELLTIFNLRPLQQLAGSRRQLFVEIDAPALRPLPIEAYSFGLWKKARVGIDYHIALEHCFYSVPYALAKEEVEVRLSQRIVEIFHQGQRVASHPRCLKPNQHQTQNEHMPVAHQVHQEWTPERLVKWAAQTGTATAQVVGAIMLSRAHTQQGFRSCLGVLRLSKGYGPGRLEAACARAISIGSPTYKSVLSILQTKLDQAPTTMSLPEVGTDHPNIRGATYYRNIQPQEKDSTHVEPSHQRQTAHP